MSAALTNEETIMRVEVPDEVGSFHIDKELRPRAKLVFRALFSRYLKSSFQIVRD